MYIKQSVVAALHMVYTSAFLTVIGTSHSIKKRIDHNILLYNYNSFIINFELPNNDVETPNLFCDVM